MKIGRFCVCKAVVASFYQSKRQKVPPDDELNPEVMIAVRDWEGINDDDLLQCADNARRLPKWGPVINRDVIMENEKLIAQRAQDRRTIENRAVIEGPGQTPATPGERREIAAEYRKKFQNNQ